MCIRFPDEFRLGAFTNPDERLRREAIGVAASGCRYAADLGASELIVWSPYDGYDYNFQVLLPGRAFPRQRVSVHEEHPM